MKQSTMQYLEKKTQQQYEIRCRELALQERKQLLEEQKFQMDRQEREKRLEIDERRLLMDEQKLKKELDLFSNQQQLITLLLQNKR